MTTSTRAIPADILAALEEFNRENAETNSEQREKLRRNLRTAILEDLTPRQREMLLLRYYEKCSGVEIARRLGVDKSSVSRTLSRARARLWKALRYSL